MKSPERMKLAMKLQEDMNSDMGGTEIVEPFKAIYKQKVKPGYPQKVILSNIFIFEPLR